MEIIMLVAWAIWTARKDSSREYLPAYIDAERDLGMRWLSLSTRQSESHILA
jgi:hypothetical protein